MGSPSQSLISPDGTVPAITAENTGGGIGISGISINGNPIGGSPGVQGVSDSGAGVLGRSTTNHAVHGESSAGRGVVGISGALAGVTGESTTSDGVFGVSKTGIGVHGQGTPAGLFDGNVQVNGHLQVNTQEMQVSGFQPFLNLVDSENKGSVRAGIQNVNGALGFFSGSTFPMTIQSSGDVTMKGTLSVAKDVVLTGADCAEHFDATPEGVFEPGTVMAICDGGALDASTKAYDKKVAGVVSGAGSFRPAVILDRQPSNAGRPAVALVGKVYCKVDAGYGAVEVGDLLTTSDTLGHAMKVSDPGKGFGAVIGKALQSLGEGKGLIPILIALA